MSEALVTILREHEPSELTVHDRSNTGYAVTVTDHVRDPGSGQVTSELPLTRDVEISRDEAQLLLAQGALWTGRLSGEPRI